MWAVTEQLRTGLTALQRKAALLLLLCSCAAPAIPASRAEDTGRVLSGLDVLLRDGAPQLERVRIGLITNHTGIDGSGASGIDRLHADPRFNLVALLSPEHSITGRVNAGDHVDSGHDPRTGLPIHSLYGATRAPTAEMLRDVDVLVFDIQDIGSRYYTYVWTMALALQAAGQHGKRFVVLDRPNPLGGDIVQGNVLDPAFATFVGLHPVPMRHGMTPGELARMLNSEHGFNADLTVIPIENWQRTQWFDDTGLPWVAPSPNMPSLESAAHYPGTCLFEGVNISVGRGTPLAFQQIGAPWLDADALVERLRRRMLPGVRFDAVTFTPQQPGDAKYADTTVRGVRFTVIDRAAYDPTVTAIATLVEIQALHADSLEFFVAHFDRLAGTDDVRRMLLAGASLERITQTWPLQLANFEAVRRRYLLYP